MAEIEEDPSLNSRISNTIVQRNPHIAMSKNRHRLQSQNIPNTSPKQKIYNRNRNRGFSSSQEGIGLPPIHPLRKSGPKKG